MIVRRQFLLAAFGLGLTASLAACSGFVPEGATSPAMLTQSGILREVNAVRAANGRGPLRYSAALASAAAAQARAMAAKDQLSHTLDGPLRERVNRVGYVGALGENVASGQKTLEQALDGWLHSPAHRNTLLSPNWAEFGLAVSTAKSGKIYWAVIFGGDSALWMPKG